MDTARLSPLFRFSCSKAGRRGSWDDKLDWVERKASLSVNLLVVTPTLWQSPWLDQTISSVSRLGRSFVHVFVAPHDSACGFIKSSESKRIIVEPRRGMYTAINSGLRQLAAEPWEWFSYINDDDVWLDGMKAALNAAEEGTVHGLIYGRVDLIDAYGHRLSEHAVARRSNDALPLLARGIVPIMQPGTLIHRKVLEELGGFDETYSSAGDIDFLARALLAGHRLRFVNRPVAAFRLHAGQISKNETLAFAEKARALRRIRDSRLRRELGPLVRFRLGNAGPYLERIWRFGPLRMEAIYRNG